MATYQEYQQQPMASNGNDFTLYPFDWSQNQSYLPTTSYADPNYLTSTSFDSYPPQQVYSHAHLADPYTFSAEHSKNELQGSASSYSPANSASHSSDYQQPPVLSSTSDSGASVQSTMSSAMGSPSMHSQHANNDWSFRQDINLIPGFVRHDLLAATGYNLETIPVMDKGCVDPSLIQPFSPTQASGAQYPELQAVHSPQQMPYSVVPSPARSRTSVRSPRVSTGKVTGSASPYMRTQQWAPYPAFTGSRRPSISSVQSRHSQGSISSDDSNKGLCPIPTCGRHFKDLKAHIITHQNERPEKCPIPACEYHTKGFARKYDKNRHTLTHYKGTMVCGFCPGSGSAAEKSFNRADVFKRHLTSVHGVEQTPPNARRKSPSGAKRPGYGVRDVSGMCSTCGVTFANAQDFYEHLDDCVLRVVQQADPSEAINEKLLSSVSEDAAVQETMEKHMLPTTVDYDAPTTFDDAEEEYDEEEEVDEDDANDITYGSRPGKSGKGSLRSRKSAGNSSCQSAHPRGVSGQHVGDANHITSSGAVGKPKKQGLTYSKNGVALSGPMTAGKGSKRKKNYPLSWGAAPEKMRMKKRVLCVYDGQRRLWKDDMMLDGDHEVRIPLHGVGDGRAWTTDLDVQTLRRAEGMHNATEEEKGPWLDEDGLEQLMQ